jgi:hypothetical protein
MAWHLEVRNETMRRKMFVPGLALAVIILFSCPSPVQAKGLVLITWGETIKHVEDVPVQPKGKLPQGLGLPGGNLAVGFHYSYFGIFWLDLWTWGGKFCLYQGQNYLPLQPNEIAEILGKSEDQLSKPWYYTFPPGLMIIVGIVGLCIVVGLFTKSPEQKVKVLLEDPRYQKALEVLSEESKKQEAAAAARAHAQSETEAQVGGAVPAEAPAAEIDKPYVAALNHLIGEGIAAHEAEQNLNLILTSLAAAPPTTS